MKKILFLLCVIPAFLLAGTSHILKIIKNDGSVERVLVEQTSKITFVADKNDSSNAIEYSRNNFDRGSNLLWQENQKSFEINSSVDKGEFYLFDMQGIQVLHVSDISAGKHILSVADKSLNAGSYIACFKHGSLLISKRISFTK